METLIAVNWIAVIVAAVARFAIGGVWYAPQLFGKQWQEAAGARRSPAEMPPALVVQAVGSLLMAYILAQVIGHYGADGLVAGGVVGFLMWLGFIAPILLSHVMLEERPMRLFYIVAGFQLVTLAVMGAIIGAW